MKLYNLQYYLGGIFLATFQDFMKLDIRVGEIIKV